MDELAYFALFSLF